MTVACITETNTDDTPATRCMAFDPASSALAEGFDAQIEQVFRNLQAVAAAAGGGLQHAVKVTVFLDVVRQCAAPNDGNLSAGERGQRSLPLARGQPVKHCAEYLRIAKPIGRQKLTRMCEEHFL